MTISETEIREIVNKILAGTAVDDNCCDEGVPPIPVEISARHVHLTTKAAKILFGEELIKKRELSQPGEFLSEQRVKLVTAKGEIANVAVLGPERSHVQVELSATDCRALGIDAPVNLSGNLEGAGDVIIIGPAGVLKADGTVIIARAHVHMTNTDAAKYKVKDGQIVRVRIDGSRPLTLEKVVIRVNDKYALAMHIDFDEANAAMAGKNTVGMIQHPGVYRENSCSLENTGQPTVPIMIFEKKLMTEADARMVAFDCGEIHFKAGTLITPAAKDVLAGKHNKIVTD